MTSMPGNPDVEIELPPGGAFLVRGPSQLLAVPTTGAGAGSLILNNRVLVQAEVSAGPERLNLYGTPPLAFRIGANMLEVDRDLVAGEMRLQTSPPSRSLALSGDHTALATRAPQAPSLLRITDANALDVLTIEVDDAVPELTMRASDALRLKGYGAFGVTLSNPAVSTGGLTVEDSVLVVAGDLTLAGGALSIARSEAPTVRLESDAVGQPFSMSVNPGSGGRALYIRGPGRTSLDPYVQVARDVVGGAPANISSVIFGFSSATTESAVVVADTAAIGRAVAKSDGARPGLLVQQGDDGQTVYWSAWRVGGAISLRVSLTVPTSASSGSQIASLP